MSNEINDCIKHWSEIQEATPGQYPRSNELLSTGSPFGKIFGFKRLGIHHESLPAGRRTSWPHAEKTEEEFVYVIEGNPDVWIDGQRDQCFENQTTGRASCTCAIECECLLMLNEK